MNSTRSSRSVLIGVLLGLSLLAVGTVAALSVSGSAPAPAEVNETVTVTVTIEDPFADMPNEWTLRGETDLEGASWTVQRFQQGSDLGTQQHGGQSFEQSLSRASGTDEIEIEVSGTVPPLSDFDYEEIEQENYTALRLASVAEGSEAEIEVFQAHRFTEKSREARQAIDAAIEAAGGRNDAIERAISSYNNGNFENAIGIAEDAQSSAQSGQLLLFGVGALVVLAVIGGGVYYWREQREKGYKLQ